MSSKQINVAQNGIPAQARTDIGAAAERAAGRITPLLGCIVPKIDARIGRMEGIRSAKIAELQSKNAQLSQTDSRIAEIASHVSSKKDLESKLSALPENEQKIKEALAQLRTFLGFINAEEAFDRFYSKVEFSQSDYDRLPNEMKTLFPSLTDEQMASFKELLACDCKDLMEACEELRSVFEASGLKGLGARLVEMNSLSFIARFLGLGDGYVSSDLLIESMARRTTNPHGLLLSFALYFSGHFSYNKSLNSAVAGLDAAKEFVDGRMRNKIPSLRARASVFNGDQNLNNTKPLLSSTINVLNEAERGVPAAMARLENEIARAIDSEYKEAADWLELRHLRSTLNEDVGLMVKRLGRLEGKIRYLGQLREKLMGADPSAWYRSALSEAQDMASDQARSLLNGIGGRRVNAETLKKYTRMREQRKDKYVSKLEDGGIAQALKKFDDNFSLHDLLALSDVLQKHRSDLAHALASKLLYTWIHDFGKETGDKRQGDFALLRTIDNGTLSRISSTVSVKDMAEGLMIRVSDGVGPRI